MNDKEHMDVGMNAASETFETALQGRAVAMADACTRCGKCVEVCPITAAAGLTAEERQNPVKVVAGVIDILHSAEGNEAARKWASGCLLSGECIKACDYGVNPRFLLYMAPRWPISAPISAASPRQFRPGATAPYSLAITRRPLST
jgi:Fe-S oxidoreductase